MSGKAETSDAEWKATLSAEQYHVLREKGTEAPFTGALLDEKRPGMFSCGACGAELFSSTDKYDSGSGWPSFTRPKDDEAVATAADTSLPVGRTEVLCPKCGSHLGHVFDDGPTESTGKRYCINSAALNFEPDLS